jgi:hypothetical protein
MRFPDLRAIARFVSPTARRREKFRKSCCADAQVLATTHDVELQQLLTNRFDFFYFREALDVREFFDFKVRPGTSRDETKCQGY